MRTFLTCLIGAASLTGCITLAPQAPADEPVWGIEWRSGGWRHCDLAHCQRPTPKTLLLPAVQPKQEPARPIESRPQPVLQAPKAVAPSPIVVSFPFASAHPTRDGLLAITRAVEDFKGVEALRVVGHTDSVGVQKANDAMAAARANYVAQKLKRLGIRARIEVQSGGKCCYAATNDTRVGRAANRRVEIHPVTITKESQ